MQFSIPVTDLTFQNSNKILYFPFILEKKSIIKDLVSASISFYDVTGSSWGKELSFYNYNFLKDVVKYHIEWAWKKC